MRIIGVDLHARQQTIAMFDSETGEVVEKTLEHEADEVREFYAALPKPVQVGIEATGIDALVSGVAGGVGDRQPGRSSSGNPRCRATQTEARPAGCGVADEAPNRKPLSLHLDTFERAARSARVAAAPSSMGAHAHARPERPASHRAQ